MKRLHHYTITLIAPSPWRVRRRRRRRRRRRSYRALSAECAVEALDAPTRAAVRACAEALAAAASPPLALFWRHAAAASPARAAAPLAAPERAAADVRMFYFVERQRMQWLTGMPGGGAECLQALSLSLYNI
jgi:hypothetical protein